MHRVNSHACGLALALTLLAGAPGGAAAQGYPDYPYSIMIPEPGTVTRHHSSAAMSATVPARVHHPSLLGREKFIAKLHRGQKMFATHGSPGFVAPAPLPKNALIPPEGPGPPVTRPLSQEYGRSVLPNGTTVPTLPHGPETFQDRASRCAFQSGLYGVPNGTTPQQAIGACVH